MTWFQPSHIAPTPVFTEMVDNIFFKELPLPDLAISFTITIISNIINAIQDVFNMFLIWDRWKTFFSFVVASLSASAAIHFVLETQIAASFFNKKPSRNDRLVGFSTVSGQSKIVSSKFWTHAVKHLHLSLRIRHFVGWTGLTQFNTSGVGTSFTPEVREVEIA